MEKNANYALVGMSTLILFVGLVVFVAWLARLSFVQEYDIYDVVFQGPVRGISQGGEVHFNGIKVGEITRIRLNPANPSQVLTTVRVDAEAPIRADSFATLEPLGITGVNYVQVTAGTTSRPLLKAITPKGQVPVIRSQRSTLSDLLEGGGTVLTRTIEALDRLNRVLSNDNIETFSGILNDTAAVTTELRKRKAIIGDAQAALQGIDEAAAQITALSRSGQELIDGDGKQSVKNMADAAGEARDAAKELRAMIAQLKGPTADFATNGLPQVTSAVISLQTAAESLERLANEIEADPRGLVGKNAAQEMKVEP